MPQPSSNLVAQVKTQATALGIDPALACALVEQESGWNPWAIRFEPAFETRYVDPLKVSATEAKARSFSWGLFQTMGEIVREMSYKGDLPALCDPTVGIPLGLQFFKKKLTQANGDVSKALLLWNGGGNAQYPAQVLARVSKYSQA